LSTGVYLYKTKALKFFEVNENWGINTVAEIDENLFVRRKPNVNRMPREQWIFGGIERDTKKCFLMCVERRNLETQLQNISRSVQKLFRAELHTIEHLDYQ
jgi:hypothetical protein